MVKRLFPSVLFILLSITILLTGCSKTISFHGKTAHWQGRYDATIDNKSNREQGNYVLRYIGPKLNSDVIQELVIKNGRKTTSMSDFNLYKGVIKIPVSCSGCALSNNDPISVVVKWEDNEEAFELMYR